MANITIELTPEQAVWLEDLLGWRFNYAVNHRERLGVRPIDMTHAGRIVLDLRHALQVNPRTSQCDES